MAKLRQVLYCSTPLMLASCLFLAASPSLASPKPKSWQTGALVSRELLIPDVTQAPSGCLFPLTVYTVDAPNYKYQLVGYRFNFSSDSKTSGITFRIDSYDGDVYVRNPKTKQVVKLRLFRKFPEPGDSESSTLPLSTKSKHRDWKKGDVSAVEPVFLSSLVLKITSRPGSVPPPCERIVAWKYFVHAGARDYTFLWRGRNALDVTIDGANEFAVGKRDSAYLIDDDGKERKVQLSTITKNP